MSKRKLIEEVASKTGESRRLVSQRGFSLATFTPDTSQLLDDCAEPQYFDWDNMANELWMAIAPVRVRR